MSDNQEPMRQALSRADEIGARAWSELVRYYVVLGAVEFVGAAIIFAGLYCAWKQFLKRRDKDDFDANLLLAAAVVATVIAGAFGTILALEGVTYLLAPGGAALKGVLP